MAFILFAVSSTSMIVIAILSLVFFSGWDGSPAAVVVVGAYKPSSFTAFQFAPNGVCVRPKLFVENHQQQRKRRTFTMRNVPGEGDCMYLAVALAAMTSMGLGANDVLLRAISKETREIVASIFESSNNGNLVIEEKRLVRTQSLLKSAAKSEGVTPERYLELLRKEGVEGGLYGGGPELAVLANVLRRPISIYELQETGDVGTNSDNEIADEEDRNSYQPIVCVGTFGDATFQDPLSDVPDSAVLSMDTLPGAYSWHLHILVVDVSPKEKHACVLLPQE
jgi:hypothetical protein